MSNQAETEATGVKSYQPTSDQGACFLGENGLADVPTLLVVHRGGGRIKGANCQSDEVHYSEG